MNNPVLKTKHEIEKMRVSGRMVAATLEHLISLVKPGISTQDLDDAAAIKIKELGGESSFLNYRVSNAVFPAHICISVEDEIVHGIPGKRILEEGQIVSIDCGIKYNGWHGDSAVTVAVGKISEAKQKLLDVCYGALWAGILAAKTGNRLSDIANGVTNYIRQHGSYGIVTGYGGHGIGNKLHEPPHVANVIGDIDQDYKLAAGYVLAIEPMVNLGVAKTKLKNDNWTVVTADKKPSAHFEHTVAILENSFEILTLRQGEKPPL